MTNAVITATIDECMQHVTDKHGTICHVEDDIAGYYPSS